MLPLSLFMVQMQITNEEHHPTFTKNKYICHFCATSQLNEQVSHSYSIIEC